MTLGEKIKAARLEAGLSQRQLCGDVITRNMLSQIENGSASPSMSTLQYLAEQLGKSMGYFLQEQAIDSPNPGCMAQARQAYQQKKYALVLEILADYRSPDPIFDQEQQYLYALCALAHAAWLWDARKPGAAATLLEQIPTDCIYYRTDMEDQRRRLLTAIYPALEDFHRQRGDFEQAYYCACKLRQMQR